MHVGLLWRFVVRGSDKARNMMMGETTIECKGRSGYLRGTYHVDGHGWEGSVHRDRLGERWVWWCEGIKWCNLSVQDIALKRAIITVSPRWPEQGTVAKPDSSKARSVRLRKENNRILSHHDIKHTRFTPSREGSRHGEKSESTDHPLLTVTTS